MREKSLLRHDRPFAGPLRKALRAARDRIAAEFDVDRIVLFGSVARGTADQESDADLLIILRGRPDHTIRNRISSVRYWWEKAQESLKAARRDHAAGAHAFAINRALAHA